jgi:hypothetical protein
MKILVYTPTYDDALHPQCRASIEAQQTTHEWEWVIDADDPFPPPDHRNVLAKYQRAQRLALAGGYDALVTVEHDMVLPPDALQKLADTTGAGVVYAPYVLRHGNYSLSTWQYCGENSLGMSLTLYPRELARYRQAGVGRISGCGWGCTLIHRNVLERIPLHSGNGSNPTGDIQFAMDCLRAGVIAYGRFDIPCGHFNTEGQLLMPYDDTTTMMRVEALEDVTVFIDGKPMRLTAGMRYTVTMAEAYDLERAGYVRIRPTEPEPEPAVERAVIESPEQATVPAQRRKRTK